MTRKENSSENCKLKIQHDCGNTNLQKLVLGLVEVVAQDKDGEHDGHHDEHHEHDQTLHVEQNTTIHCTWPKRDNKTRRQTHVAASKPADALSG